MFQLFIHLFLNTKNSFEYCHLNIGSEIGLNIFIFRNKTNRKPINECENRIYA